MVWFRNIKIRNKLFIVFGAVMLMVAMLSAFTVQAINNIEESYSKLLNGPLARYSSIFDATREMKAIRIYTLLMGYASDDTETAKYYFKRYLKSELMFLEYTENYHKNLKKDVFLPVEERDTCEKAIISIQESFINNYAKDVNAAYHSILDGDLRQANTYVMKSMSAGEEITENLNALRILVQQTALDMSGETSEFIHKSNITVICISILILLIAFIFSILMSWMIKEPIVTLETAMSEIAKGDLTYPIRSNFKDEMGLLSNRIGDMLDTISKLNETVTIIDNLDDMILVTDLNYNMVFMNRKAAEIYRLNKDEAVNKKCYEVLYGYDKPCEACHLPLLEPEKDSCPSGDWERLLTINGKDVWFACRTSIIRWIDGSLVQIYIYKDDSVRKEKEEERHRYEEELREAALEAEEASRLKSAFLANMSHEIRTPMNGIIGFSELALSDNIPSKTRDYLSKIKLSSESLMQIINDILDISKIEAGKIELENVCFDIHEVFRLCRTITMPKALEKGLTLFCYAEPSVYKVLVGDPTRLRQALLNLLSNAVKFTNAGMIKLLSAIKETTQDSVTIHFEIKDNGIGMTPEQIDKIFQPFMQADDSTTRKYGGTGLGLSITKNIIELMGGELMVESAPGIGSKFSFELTFKTVDSPSMPQAITEDITDKVSKPQFIGEVLVCEDNELNRQVINDNLKRVGLKADIVLNGREGVLNVRRRMDNNEKPFDLILMDIHMPIMDGLEAAKALSEMGNKTPVIALTANIMPSDMETYRSLGMRDCVPKPFRSHELWACLLKYLKPVGYSDINTTEQSGANEKQRQMLLASFVKDNQNTVNNIKDAVQGGDIKFAHRLAHTLKSVAALIGMTMLQEAARVIEHSLSNGKAEFTPEQISILEYELNAAIAELAPQINKAMPLKPPAESFDRQKAARLISELDASLEADSFEALNLVGEFYGVKGAEQLIEQVEKFEFKAARDTLNNLKQEWREEYERQKEAQDSGGGR